MDSCFELLGSRQRGVARHLEEQPSESNVPPNARGGVARHLEEQPSESNVPPNARGSDLGQWREPSSSKQLSTVAAVDSRFGLYHVAVVLSLILYAVSALLWVTQK